MPDCTIIRAGATYSGLQGLEYATGVWAQTAGARALCLHRLTLPPAVARERTSTPTTSPRSTS